MKKLYKLDNINLNYNINGNDIRVLKNINFEIKKNERVALTGESGSGKTSLLMLMSGLENPSKGSLIFENKDFSKISEEQKTTIRKKKIGLVFQQFYLIPNYTALENVMFPMQINKIKNEKEKASLILSDIGLDNRKNNLPSELSGGEQQRVAIARAISFNPEVILADEPTGNLDIKNTELVSNLLLNYTKKKKISLFLVTHNINLAKKCDRVINLFDGQIKN
ncbi:MAG: ABC transporter ATP-binding protein [Alphaproteobacteria bacterium]